MCTNTTERARISKENFEILCSRLIEERSTHVEVDWNCQTIGRNVRTVQIVNTKMSAEVEERLKRIQAHKGVVGVIVVNSEGIPIKSTLDNPTTIQYTGLISGLTDKAKSVVRDLDPTNDLTFLRVRSKKHEIMIAPDSPSSTSVTMLSRLVINRSRRELCS
ncbi:dynein light chain roadblock-type 2-like isoform X2 [Oratosquilla oratoria]|uniref:dynein light chain roadblock-type 2-like isoform X2 n=1 Tax=Oratosquilla oratoria TaxID=337810 RepID=UPI003F75CE84